MYLLLRKVLYNGRKTQIFFTLPYLSISRTLAGYYVEPFKYQWKLEIPGKSLFYNFETFWEQCFLSINYTIQIC